MRTLLNDLLEEFLKIMEDQGISRDDLYLEQDEDCAVVSFGEETEDKVPYNVALAFYKKQDAVEIYVRKQIDGKNLLEVLKRVNRLNAEYVGITFFVDEEVLSTKSVCRANGDIRAVMMQMVENMQIAKEEFPAFPV